MATCSARVRLAAASLVTCALLGSIAASERAQAQSFDVPLCTGPTALTRLDRPLLTLARRLARHEPVRIVALGSSSTAGVGASSPRLSYVSRLEAELRHHYPSAEITVLNRGLNGEDAAENLARLDAAVLAERPQLVIWQVGANAAVRGTDPTLEAELIRDGIRRIRAEGAEVLILDPQYSPRTITPSGPAIVDAISAVAKEQQVGVFRRFGLMRHWHDVDHIAFEDLFVPDLLHMNDWSHGCLAKLMADAMVGALNPPTASVQHSVQQH